MNFSFMRICWELNQLDYFLSLLTAKMLTLRLRKLQSLALETCVSSKKFLSFPVLLMIKPFPLDWNVTLERWCWFKMLSFRGLNFDFLPSFFPFFLFSFLSFFCLILSFFPFSFLSFYVSFILSFLSFFPSSFLSFSFIILSFFLLPSFLFILPSFIVSLFLLLSFFSLSFLLSIFVSISIYLLFFAYILYFFFTLCQGFKWFLCCWALRWNWSPDNFECFTNTSKKRGH